MRIFRIQPSRFLKTTGRRRQITTFGQGHTQVEMGFSERRVEPDRFLVMRQRFRTAAGRFEGISETKMDGSFRNYLDHSLPLPLCAGKIPAGFQQESQTMMQQPVVASPVQRMTVDPDRPSEPFLIRLPLQVGEQPRPTLDQFLVVELFRKGRLLRSPPPVLRQYFFGEM